MRGRRRRACKKQDKDLFLFCCFACSFPFLASLLIDFLKVKQWGVFLFSCADLSALFLSISGLNLRSNFPFFFFPAPFFSFSFLSELTFQAMIQRSAQHEFEAVLLTKSVPFQDSLRTHAEADIIREDVGLWLLCQKRKVRRLALAE